MLLLLVLALPYPPDLVFELRLFFNFSTFSKFLIFSTPRRNKINGVRADWIELLLVLVLLFHLRFKIYDSKFVIQNLILIEISFFEEMTGFFSLLRLSLSPSSFFGLDPCFCFIFYWV